MTYQFIHNVSQKEHDAFVSMHQYCNLLQSSSWAAIKENWGSAIVGVKENGVLIASALVLIKHLPLGFTMMYTPRGPILDYEKKDVVVFFFQELKRWSKKQRCLFMKLDPEIHIKDYTLQNKESEVYANISQILTNMKDAGAIHQGFTTFIAETIQPRFHMGIKACENMDDHIPRATLRSKNVGIRKHVRVSRVGKEGLDNFSRIMHMTENRKSVQLRNKEYFELLMDTYQEHAYLFLAKANPHERGDELMSRLVVIREELLKDDLGNKQRKKLETEVKQVQDELDSMQDLLAKYTGEEVIAGGLMVGFGDCVEMLYAGMNEDFRSFRPQYLTYLTQFTYAFEHGYSYVTMGGVEGTLEDGLSVYKANFNPLVNEFIGEFDLPVHQLFYKVSQFVYRLRKKKNLEK